MSKEVFAPQLTDAEFLEVFVFNRMVMLYGENPQGEIGKRLRGIIKEMSLNTTHKEDENEN